MLVSTISTIESLPLFKEAGIDGVIVSIPHFSIRTLTTVSLEALPIWKKACQSLNMELYINMTKFIMEEEIEELKNTLSYLKQIDVDGIYYGDEAIYYEAKQIGLENRLIYQPETLVTSFADVSFYESLGIKAVSLAHELSLDEIVTIAGHSSLVEVLIHGYFSILYSRRPLVKNYLHYMNKEYSEKKYELIESTREERMPLIQDKEGTYIFSSQPLQSFQELSTLKEAGIHRFRIDSIFMEEEEVLQAAKAYRSILDQQQDSKTIFLRGSNRWYREKTRKKKEGE